MNVADYLINPEGKGWPRLLADWVPPLPADFTVWLVNRLGEVFAVDAGGAVLRLDTGMGRCEQVADSREHFARLLDTAGVADLWLRLKLVDDCRRAGMQLAPGQCYSFRIPPTLGGKYEASNLKPTELAVHFSYQAYILKQADIYWIPPA